jgi:hypothetical protein
MRFGRLRAERGLDVSDRIVVTLIHGTFATKAPWVEKESELCRAVEKAFPGRVEFRRFSWSGGNTIGARRDAAERLRTQIVADHVPAAGTQHFLVAHSHGGNIALYALRDPTARGRVTGVATLSTPFLIARRRDLGTRGLVLFCIGFLGWGWLAGELVRRLIWPSAEWIPAILGTGLFMLLTGLVMWLWRQAGTVEKDLKLADDLPQGRLWIARIPGDEATSGLQAAQFAGIIVAQIHLSFVRAIAWAERTGGSSSWISFWRVAGGLAVAVFIWVLGTFLGVDERSAPVLWSFIIAIGIGALIILWGLLPQAPRVVVPYAIGLVAPLAFALSTLLVLPFGPTLAVYSFLLEITAEATPLGTWTVHQHPPVLGDATVGREEAPMLLHSWVYNQDKVLEDLTTWMKGCTTPMGVEPTFRRSS